MATIDEIISSGRAPAQPVENVETRTQEAPVEQAEVAEPEAVETPEGAEGERTVPVAALQKEREKAKRYTEQVASFETKLEKQNLEWQQRFAEQAARYEQLVTALQPKQQPQQPPEFWDAPEQAIDYRLQQTLTPIQQAIATQREEMSRLMASEKHGETAVNEAYQALASVRGTPDFEANYRRIMSSPHPYGALVEWHKQQQVLSEIGSDPAAYKEKLKAELLAEMQVNNGGQAAQPAPAPVGSMPSNFATARNVGTRSGPAWGGPTPLTDIFKR